MASLIGEDGASWSVFISMGLGLVLRRFSGSGGVGVERLVVGGIRGGGVTKENWINGCGPIP